MSFEPMRVMVLSAAADARERPVGYSLSDYQRGLQRNDLKGRPHDDTGDRKEQLDSEQGMEGIVSLHGAYGFIELVGLFIRVI